jgi:hypothetical protein
MSPSLRFGICKVVIFGVFATPALLSAQTDGLSDTEAQPDQPQQGEANRGATAPIPATDVPVSSTIRHPPLTTWEKFKYHMQRSVDATEFLRAGAGGALNQWRDHPTEWGQGWDSYGVRVASHFGQHFVKQQILFAVQAIDHESPEHLRSHRHGLANRVKDSIRYTFTSGTDDGKFMPAYSRFIGAYGAAFIARTWYPDSYQTFGSGLKAGTTSLGIDVGMNLLREFWPDIKKRLRRQ